MSQTNRRTLTSSYRSAYERIKRLAEERGDLLMDDGGDYMFWPSGGYLSADELRVLADILDDKNVDGGP